MTTIVVKCGGNSAVNTDAVCADIGRWRRRGRRIVLVHGGSAEIDQLADRLGVATARHVGPDGASSRLTTAEALEIVLLALAGAVKPRLVSALAGYGVPAIGLTGLDGAAVRARRVAMVRTVMDGRPMLVRDLHGGRVTRVNRELLRGLLQAGYVPVLSPPAADEADEPVNVDADAVAAAVASTLGASALVLLTGAPGVLADHADERTLITTYRSDQPLYAVRGGMAPKLAAARTAAASGVTRVIVGDGRRAEPLTAALDGCGTEVVAAGRRQR